LLKVVRATYDPSLEVRYSFLLRVAQEDMLGQRKMKSYE
jgi:hypothetical protein